MGPPKAGLGRKWPPPRISSCALLANHIPTVPGSCTLGSRAAANQPRQRARAKDPKWDFREGNFAQLAGDGGSETCIAGSGVLSHTSKRPAMFEGQRACCCFSSHTARRPLLTPWRTVTWTVENKEMTRPNVSAANSVALAQTSWKGPRHQASAPSCCGS